MVEDMMIKEGEAQTPSHRTRIFKVLEEAIDFLAWANPMHLALKSTFDKEHKIVYQLDYVQEE